MNGLTMGIVMMTPMSKVATGMGETAATMTAQDGMIIVMTANVWILKTKNIFKTTLVSNFSIRILTINILDVSELMRRSNLSARVCFNNIIVVETWSKSWIDRKHSSNDYSIDLLTNNNDRTVWLVWIF